MPTVLITDLPEVKVDFNSSVGDNFRVSQGMNPAIWPTIAVDRWVLAGDDEGNHCAAKVTAVHGAWAELQPEWSTWLASDENPIVWSRYISEGAIVSEEPRINSYVDLENGFQPTRSAVYEPSRQPVLAA
jgi:hypothetical protein